MADTAISPLQEIISSEEKYSAITRIKVYLFFVVVVGLFFILGVSWHFYQQDKQGLVNSIEAESPAKLDVISQDIALSIFNVTQDVQFLAKLHEKFLRHNNHAVAISDSEEVMYEMIRLNPKYAQIRLLKVDGNEEIRVERDASNIQKVSRINLQNKANRYYFIEGTGLAKEQVYISPIDLNVEHGEVEIPYKPMMRFIAPVFDDKKVLTAMMVINYDANNLLNTLEKYSNPNVSLMLLNNDGYWLKSPDHKNEWGFMFEEKRDYTFGNQYPQAWTQMINEVSGKFLDENGIFSFQTVNFADIAFSSSMLDKRIELSPSLPDKDTWKIVSFLPSETVDSVLFSMRIRYTLTIMLILLLLFSSTYFFYRFMLYRAKHHSALLHHAYYDELTGVGNRAAFMASGAKLYQKHKDFSLIYIDLDDFKPVNDQYGHQVGDTVLMITAQRILKLLRDKDAAFRLGGDEFLVLLPGKQTKEELDRIQLRLVGEIEHEMHVENHIIQISLTTGTGQSHKFNSLKSLLHAADRAMYREKNTKKSTASDVWLAE